MYVKIEKCPVCEHKEFTNELISEDYLVSRESFAIVKCNNCDFKFTNPRPSADVLDNYYQSENYISHSGKITNPVNLGYKIVRKFTLRKKLNLINSLYKKKGTVLDVGCGTGEFIYTCQKNGWIVEGVEPNDYARQKANELVNSNLYADFFHVNNKSEYDIITLWHVLEHIPDLNKSLEKLKSMLAKKGRMIVAVPNCDSFDAKYYQQYWAAYDLPRHLYHFTPVTMKKLIKKHGLKLKKVLPMPFDSYYVSMLSEKYKTGKNNYFKAVKIGYMSNKKAKISDNKFNHSSLIYIIKK